MEILKITARDGVPLGVTLYEPESPAAADHIVVVSSATGVKRRFYDRFARFLADSGFLVVTFDYRGIGDSRPTSLRRFEAHMRDWGERDLAAVIDWAADRYPTARLLLIGHSVGGQLVGLAANAGRVAGMLFVAAQSGWYGHWPRPRRFGYAFLWRVLVPAVSGALGYFPARRLGLGEDLPAGVALEWARWCRNPNYMVDDAGHPLRPYFDRFTSRLVALSVADDLFAPRQAVDALVRWYTHADVRREHIEPRAFGLRSLGHFGFFRESGAVLWPRALHLLRNL